MFSMIMDNGWTINERELRIKNIDQWIKDNWLLIKDQRWTEMENCQRVLDKRWWSINDEW